MKAQVVRRPAHELPREAPTSPSEMPKPTSPLSPTSPAGEVADGELVGVGISVGDVSSVATPTSIAGVPGTPDMEVGVATNHFGRPEADWEWGPPRLSTPTASSRSSDSGWPDSDSDCYL